MTGELKILQFAGVQRKFHSDIYSFVRGIRVERRLDEAVLSVQFNGRRESSVGKQIDTALAIFACMFDAGGDEFVPDPATSLIRRDCHFRELESVIGRIYQRDSTYRLFIDDSNEYLAAGTDDLLDRIIEHVAVVLLNSEVMFDPIVVQIGERFRVLRCEPYNSNIIVSGHLTQRTNLPSRTLSK